MLSVTDRRTDDSMVPVADRTVKQYDRLKMLAMDSHKTYHTITLIFLACAPSNVVLKKMTFLGFYVYVSFYQAYVPFSPVLI